MRLYKYSRKEKKEKTARYRLASLTLSFPAKQLSLLPHNHDTRFFHIFKTYFNKKLQQPAFIMNLVFNDIDKIEQLCADHVLHCRWSLDALISHSYHGENVLLPTFVITSSIPVITLLFIIPWRIIYWMSTFICVRVTGISTLFSLPFLSPLIHLILSFLSFVFSSLKIILK